MRAKRDADERRRSARGRHDDGVATGVEASEAILLRLGRGGAVGHRRVAVGAEHGIRVRAAGRALVAPGRIRVLVDHACRRERIERDAAAVAHEPHAPDGVAESLERAAVLRAEQRVAFDLWMRRDVAALQRRDARIARDEAAFDDPVVGIALLRPEQAAVAANPQLCRRAHGDEAREVHVGMHAVADERVVIRGSAGARRVTELIVRRRARHAREIQRRAPLAVDLLGRAAKHNALGACRVDCDGLVVRVLSAEEVRGYPRHGGDRRACAVETPDFVAFAEHVHDARIRRRDRDREPLFGQSARQNNWVERSSKAVDAQIQAARRAGSVDHRDPQTNAHAAARRRPRNIRANQCPSVGTVEWGHGDLRPRVRRRAAARPETAARGGDEHRVRYRIDREAEQPEVGQILTLDIPHLIECAGGGRTDLSQDADAAIAIRRNGARTRFQLARPDEDFVVNRGRTELHIQAATHEHERRRALGRGRGGHGPAAQRLPCVAVVGRKPDAAVSSCGVHACAIAADPDVICAARHARVAAGLSVEHNRRADRHPEIVIGRWRRPQRDPRELRAPHFHGLRDLLPCVRAASVLDMSDPRERTSPPSFRSPARRVSVRAHDAWSP